MKFGTVLRATAHIPMKSLEVIMSWSKIVKRTVPLSVLWECERGLWREREEGEKRRGGR